MQKRAAMEMSFGMIFSIILIIFFLTFAFFGIKTFLGIQDTASTTKFLNDLKSDIDQVWKSSQTSQEKVYSLPSKFDYVCFVDFPAGVKGEGLSQRFVELKRAYYGHENLVFYPVSLEELGSAKIDHIDISKTTNLENPLCIKNERGKVKLRLKKEFNEALVTITR